MPSKGGSPLCQQKREESSCSSSDPVPTRSINVPHFCQKFVCNPSNLGLKGIKREGCRNQTNAIYHMRRECREAVKKRKQEANRLSSPIMMPPCRKKRTAIAKVQTKIKAIKQ